MQFGSLGKEDPLEKEMATHPSILAWRISWTEVPAGLQSKGCKESDTTEATEHSPSTVISEFGNFDLIFFFCIRILILFILSKRKESLSTQ